MSPPQRSEPFSAGYYSELVGSARVRYEEKVQMCDGMHPYTLRPGVDTTIDVNVFPEVTHGDIVNYLVYSSSFVTLEEMKAFKSMEADNYFTSGWARSLAAMPLRDEKVLLLGEAMLTVSYGVENTSRKTAELHLSVDETSTAAQIHDYMGRSLHHLREPAILLLKVSLSASFYNAIILHILSGARGALDAEVFSELSKMLSGAEAESADVPRMIKELGRVLRESPEKEKFLKMTSEEACQWLSTVENECGKKYREFIKKHGHRAVKEFDVYIKPWSLDPSTLVKSLKAAAASPQVEQKASSASWDASKVPYKLSTFQRALLTLVAPKARAAVEAREAAKVVLVNKKDGSWRSASTTTT
ncbi:uncharacterized protein LOC119440828 [Dermacentor silvarum]|uniref:uncharacterized protein LOC119440828 n=1 Tax=Dermacentor silvarum TaxID=543639 RepID=UPI0021008D8D|nr:uncharacterized protein LOC119440828 [Dermacentor silvarum]